MNHAERVNLAGRLTDYLLEKLGDEILLGGIYGSTARNTDTEYSDLEMLFIVKNDSTARSFSFAYEGMPVNVTMRKLVRVERDVEEIELDWPLKMGRLFGLLITCGETSFLEKFESMHARARLPERKVHEFLARETPLCYEGLGRLKAVKIRRNTHEIGLFVAEILMEFTLLTALFNREFITHDYLGGLFEAFKFRKLPKNYERIARKLTNWTSVELDEIIHLADEFVKNFVGFLAENGVAVKEHTSLEMWSLKHS